MPPANTGEEQENEPTLSQNIRVAVPRQGLELSKVGAGSPRRLLSGHSISHYLMAVKCQNSNSYLKYGSYPKSVTARNGNQAREAGDMK